MTDAATSRVDSLRENIPSSWRAEHMPAYLRHAEGSVKNRRGQALSYVALFPEANKPVRGIVFFLHGINEHCRRYYHLYEQLCESGFGVLAYDLLSHGQSESCEHNQRAHAKWFHYFIDDTNDVLAFAKTQLFRQFLRADAYPTLPPLVLTGMSYGTLVGLHTVLSEQHAFSGIVLVAPAVAVEMTAMLRVQRLFAKPLSTLLPKVRIVPAVNREWMCRDPAFIDDFENDPLTVGGEMSTRMGEQSMAAMIQLQNDVRVEQAASSLCAAPMLLLMGSSDKVTSLPLAQEFYHRVASRDKEFKVFDRLYHALFDDPEKDRVFDHLIGWLQHRFPEIVPAGAAVDTDDVSVITAAVEAATVAESEEVAAAATARETK